MVRISLKAAAWGWEFGDKCKLLRGDGDGLVSSLLCVGIACKLQKLWWWCQTRKILGPCSSHVRLVSDEKKGWSTPTSSMLSYNQNCGLELNVTKLCHWGHIHFEDCRVQCQLGINSVSVSWWDLGGWPGGLSYYGSYHIFVFFLLKFIPILTLSSAFWPKPNPKQSHHHAYPLSTVVKQFQFKKIKIKI